MADKEDSNNMDVNTPEHVVTEMQDVATSPGINHQMDNTPCQVDKQLDFVTINKEGHLLLGSSGLTGRYWGGSLWYYDNPALAPSVEKCRVGYEAGSGLPDGVFLDGEKIVMVGLDSGAVEFLKLSQEEESLQMRSLCQVTEHLDAVVCVKVTCQKKSALTGSLDRSIRVWDNETSLVTKLLSPAHSQQVTSLSPHPANDHLFLSAGMDGNVLLWDLRCPKPASCVYRDWDDKPESVLWVGEDDHYLVGLQSGQVALRCTTNLNHSVTTCQTLSRPIYKLELNPTRPSQVAVCGNDSKVIVLDIVNKEIKKRYEDNRHTDFVRGLAWTDSNSLVSCGWDSSVHIHGL
ncbi:hypothetical protein Pcinc_027121 [Petrolisthes cinctipes]|uniref:Methylosome protein 50 n=1 Tax=Petrolisthes cinctipes TaxID=88211 RepID=A0AAE1K774_PETCI|nr:hypothetical protein Pcinc_027121 [Petrolisthes cinctipes]